MWPEPLLLLPVADGNEARLKPSEGGAHKAETKLFEWEANCQPQRLGDDANWVGERCQ